MSPSALIYDMHVCHAKRDMNREISAAMYHV